MTFTAPNGSEVDVWAKTSPIPDGRRVITTLVMRGDRINSAITSRFPIGWLEAQITSGNDLLAGMSDPCPDPLPVDENSLGPGIYTYTTVSADRPPLARPEPGGDPDRFYAQVAEAYRAALNANSPIAPTLAKEAGVPVRTVHRWISEARRRGHLPPSGRGRQPGGA